MKSKIESVVEKSGLWADGRRRTHGFMLSPSVYQVDDARFASLEAFAAAVDECLRGLCLVAKDTQEPKMLGNHTFGRIARALRVGVPSHYHDLMFSRPDDVPGIYKVDLMEDASGAYRIAEIDAHNKHGFGYSTLCARMRDAAVTNFARQYPGVAVMLADEVVRKGFDRLVLLAADQERYYEPEFAIIQDEIKRKYGMEVTVARECASIVGPDGRTPWNRNGDRALLVDLPFLYHNMALNKALIEGYKDGSIEFVIPPKPFLGSKAVLALLRNDTQDEVLEGALTRRIPAGALATIRGFIPETYLVHPIKQSKGIPLKDRIADRRFVLKEVIASGMKGTIFTDDARFPKAMEEAMASHYRFVLQEEVTNAPRTFDTFASDGSVRTADDWFMRVIAHVTCGVIADVVVTARRDKRVHGALDCIQIGSIIA